MPNRDLASAPRPGGESSDLAPLLLRWKDSDRPAVVERGAQWAYSDFVQSAVAYGAFFKAQGMSRVLLCLPQSFDAYALIWGAYLSGTQFCSLHHGSPTARIVQCTQAFKPDVAIGIDETLGGVSVAGLQELCRFGSSVPLASVTDEEGPAYVLFTSGSTGHPKGVQISRDSLGHVVNWALREYAVQPEDVWGQYSSLGFDLSLLDVFTALSAGAALVPLSTPGDKLMPAEAIRAHAVTLWHSVPSAFELMDRSRRLTPENLASLRLVLFCGECLYPSLVQKIFDANKKVVVYNTYGPTETTILCSAQRLTHETLPLLSRNTVSIGHPLPGNQFSLDGDEVDYGELVIAGRNVGLGYLDSEPHSGYQCGNSSRPTAYRTGDFVKVIDGEMYFDRRIDSQVKVRGHRVDLSEIDHELRRIGCSSAVSVLIDGRIVSFVLNPPFDETTIRDQLGKVLPDYYLPARIVPRATFPYSASGKIDTTALRLTATEASQ